MSYNDAEKLFDLISIITDKIKTCIRYRYLNFSDIG